MPCRELRLEQRPTPFGRAPTSRGAGTIFPGIRLTPTRLYHRRAAARSAPATSADDRDYEQCDAEDDRADAHREHEEAGDECGKLQIRTVGHRYSLSYSGEYRWSPPRAWFGIGSTLQPQRTPAPPRRRRWIGSGE